MTLLDELKFNLREEASPYFTEEELQTLLSRHSGDVKSASYEGLLMKAEDDSIALPGGLNVPSNRSYWLGLAKRFRSNVGTVLTRVDE